MWNFSKFVAFLIDTNDNDANPSSTVNVWLVNISKLTRDASVPPSIQKFTSELLTHQIVSIELF